MIPRSHRVRITWPTIAIFLVIACMSFRTVLVSLLGLTGPAAGMLFDVAFAGAMGGALAALWYARGSLEDATEESGGASPQRKRDHQRFVHTASCDSDTPNLWRRIALQAPIGIIEGDKDGIVVFANAAWCAITGVMPGEVVGRPLPTLVHQDDLPATTAAWERSVAERQPYHHQVRLKHSDGRYRTVIASASPVFDDGGNFQGSISSAFDLTDFIAAQRQHDTAEGYIRAIMDHTSAAVYLKDLDDRFLLVNRHYEKLFPHMKDVCIGTTTAQWFPPEVVRRFIADDTIVMQAGHAISVEEEVPQAGEIRHFITVKFPVRDRDGQFIAVGGMATDITEIKIARNELQQKERVLRRLIDVQEHEKQLLCHEFHDGPIQYAVGAHMLLQQLHGLLKAGPEAESVIAVLSLIKQCIDEARRVIQGIRPTLLDDCGLRSALADLASRVGGKFQVRSDLTGDLDSLSESLRTTVYRVCQEALTNIQRHSRAKRIHVRVQRQDEEIFIEIHDDGDGFDVNAKSLHGFGLLGMSQRVRLAGGTFAVESSAGRGTTITARMPVQV